MAVDHALKDVPEVSIGLDVIELSRGDKRTDRCPSPSAAIGASEHMILSPERDGSDGALDGIVVEFNATKGFCRLVVVSVSSGSGTRAMTRQQRE